MVTREVTGLSELHALLGEGASFEGTLTFDGRVRIDGAFRGKILSTGVLILGHRAEVDARIEVGTLIVLGGTLRGEVVAQKAVELHPDAHVYASVTAPQLMVDRGAVFEGESRRPERAAARPEVEIELSPEAADPVQDSATDESEAEATADPPREKAEATPLPSERHD